MERLVLPRVYLRDLYMIPAVKRLDTLRARIGDVEQDHRCPDASLEILELLKARNLGATSVFLSSSITKEEATDLYMPLAALTSKMLQRITFNSDEDLYAFYNRAISDYLEGYLTVSMTVDEMRDELINFITRAHFAAAGASWDGDCRNLSGRATLALFQRLFLQALDESELQWSAKMRGREKERIRKNINSFSGFESDWIDPLDSGSILKEIRVGGQLTVKFGEPDLVISCRGEVILIGEVKGRTDISNLYESWMPTVQAKLEKARNKFPSARRLAVQLFISEKMLGDPKRPEPGLEDMRKSGLLDAVYSIVKMHFDPRERLRLGEEIRQLLNTCKKGELSPSLFGSI